VDRRTLDELVKSITRELSDQPASKSSPTRPASSGGGSGSFYLIDNWRVREAQRDAFVGYYSRHVADVLKQMAGYRGGRVLVAVSPDYSWQVQALYEFETEAVLDRFEAEFNRIVRRIDPSLDVDKVLDAMDDWVLAHEDGTLHEVWR